MTTELEKLMPQVATALRLAWETFNDDAPGPGVSEREALRRLSEAHWELRQLYKCNCGYTDPYGWVPEAGCPLHDPREQEQMSITPEQRLRNLAALVATLTEPTRVNVGRHPNNYTAGKQEIADAARQLAEEVEHYLDGELAAVDGDTPF